MKTILSLCLICVMISTQAQHEKEKELKTTLTEVTVFLDGAQLFEKGLATIPAEKSTLRIKNLSPYLDEKSIQVKGEGDFTILSVNHKFNYLDKIKKDQGLDSLKNIQETLQDNINQQNARLSVLLEKQSLLNENKELNGQSSGGTIAQLKLAVEFYDIELSKIKEEELRINKKLSTQKQQLVQIEKQLKEQNNRKILPTSEIEIRISANKVVQGKFSITYLVSNAGWFPKYDVRVKDVNSPLTLTYKAEVFQNTGVDWKNVKLRFSNGVPNQSGLIPTLQPWLLNYAQYTRFDKSIFSSMQNTGQVKGRIVDENGGALPGVNVVVRGTTIGTATDANGQYSITLPSPNSSLVVSFIGYVSQEIQVTKSDMNFQMSPDQSELQEVVVTGYSSDISNSLSGKVSGIKIRGISSFAQKSAPILTTFIENQTTVEIEVKEPYTINSDGEKRMVELTQYEIPAIYEYYAVPKIDRDAFLMARVVQWDQYNLLEGEANLYFEEAFVGKSILNAQALSDTLSISLGRDKSIAITRTKVDQLSRKHTFGSNQTDTRGFKIVVKNKKNQPIKLTLFDQLPVAVNSNITVSPIELTDAAFDQKSGALTWQYILEPQQQKEIILHYEVKYPKRESVVLE